MIETNTISLTRALAEVNLIEKKMAKAVSESKVTVFDIRTLTKDDTDRAKNSQEADQASFEELFNRRQRIKASIAKANVETKVKVEGKEYSIIELIDMKSSLEFKQRYYEEALNQLSRAEKEVESAELRVDKEVSNKVEAAFSGKANTPKSFIEDLTESYKKMYGKEIHTIFTRESLSETLDRVSDMRSNIDMLLSEVNARTEIKL